MFCCTIRTVFLAIAYATAILPGSSSIKTMSAASIAASWPIAPIAIPTSARIKTGASLIPSPVKINVLSSSFSRRSCSTLSTLSPGISSAHTVSMPSSFATLSATSFLSPVSITTLSIPHFLIDVIASLTPSLISSAIVIHPLYTPFSATKRTVPTLEGCFAPAMDIFLESSSFLFPTNTSFPSFKTLIPIPEISSYPSRWSICTVPLYAALIDAAIGWLE